MSDMENTDLRQDETNHPGTLANQGPVLSKGWQNRCISVNGRYERELELIFPGP